MDALDERAVFQGDHFDRERRRGASHPVCLFAVGRFKAGYLYGTQSADVAEGAEGMRAVIKRVHRVAPMAAVAVGERRPARFAVVQIFPLSVLKFSQRPALHQPPHFAHGVEIAVIFRIKIFFSAFFLFVAEFGGLFQRGYGQYFAENVQAALQAADGVRRMLVGVVGEHDRVHVAG